MDTKGIPQLTIKGYRKLLRQNVHGLLGPPWSTDSDLVGHMSTLDKVPVVGFYAPSVRLGNGKDFPFFNRVNPSTKVQAQAVVELMHGLEFNHFAALYQRSDTYLHLLEELDIALRAVTDVSITALDEAFFLEWDMQSTELALQNIRRSGARVILGAFTFYQLEMVMNCATKVELIGSDFVWIGVDFTITAAGIYHARPFLKEAMQGFFGFEYASPRVHNSFHRFVASWEEAQLSFCQNTTPGASPPRIDTVASWAYDAVISLGLALSQVEDPSNGTSVQAVLDHLSFAGSSGPVAFSEHARDVEGMYVRVFNFQYGPGEVLTEVVISEYPVTHMSVRSSAAETDWAPIEIDYDLIRWGNGSRQKPDAIPFCPTGTAWNTQTLRCSPPCEPADLVYERTECDSHTLRRTGTVVLSVDASCTPGYDIGIDREIEFNCDHIPTNSDLYLAMSISAVCVIGLIYLPALLYSLCSTRRSLLSTSFYVMSVLQFCGAALCSLSAFYFAGEAHTWRCVGQLLLYMLGCFVVLGFTLLKLYWLSLGNAPKEWVLHRMSRPVKIGCGVGCLYLAYAITGLVGEKESDGGRRAMIYPTVRNDFPGSPSAFDDQLCEATTHAYQVVGCLLYGLLYGCGLALAFYTHRNRRSSSGLDTSGYMVAAVCIGVLLLIPIIVWMQGSGAICEAQFSVSITTVYMLFCISPIAVCVILCIVDYLSFTAARRAVMLVMHDRDKALALRTLNDDLLRAYDDLRSTTLRRRSHRKNGFALQRRESLKGLATTVGARITGDGPRTRTTAESSEGAEEEDMRIRQQRIMIEHYKTRRSAGTNASSMRVQVGGPTRATEPNLAHKITGALRAAERQIIRLPGGKSVRLRRRGNGSPSTRDTKPDAAPAHRANPNACASDAKPGSPLRKASLAASLHINGMLAQRSSSHGRGPHTDLPPFARAREEALGVLPQHTLSHARLAEFEAMTKRGGVSPAPGHVIRLLLAEAKLMPQAEKRGKLTMVAAALRDTRYTLKHFHDDVVEIFGPELRLYLGHAQLHCRPMSGRSVAEEYKRTLGALFALYWLYRLEDREVPMSEGLDGQRGFCFGVDADWLPPRADQVVYNLSEPAGSAPEAKRHAFLSTMNWRSIQQLLIDSRLLVRNTDGTLRVELQRTAAMLALTAIHDIMKVKELLPTVAEAHAPYCGYRAGEVIYDHDVALGYVLEHDPAALPCFDCLDSEQRRAVSFTQAELGFNHGWLVQAEAPPGATFSRLKAVITDTGVDQADIAFYFVHWLTDLAGAEPTPLNGAEKFVVKFPQAVLTRLIDSIPMVERLANMPPTTLMQEYLVHSWPTEGLNRPPPSGRPAIALMRLVMQAQTLEYQQLIVEAFDTLGESERAILVHEMALSGIENEHYSGMPTQRGGPAFLLYYSPAFLRHCAQEDASMALCILAEIYREARGLWPLGADREGQGVSVHLGAIKSMSARQIMAAYDRGEVWLLVQTGCQDGVVEKRSLSDLPAFLVKKKARVLKLWPSRWRTEAEPSLATLAT